MNIEQLAILYVEDEARSQRVMRMIANDIGISQLTIFEHSQDFLRRAQMLSPKPDLIFLDIHVQPISGFDMLKLLKHCPHFNGIPVVAMTASVMNEEIDQLRAAGFDGCLAKPVDIDTFPETVQRIVDGEAIWREIV